MPLPRRDPELTHKQFVPWVRSQLPNAQDLRVSEFGGSGTTGFSNDTLLFELSWREDGRAHEENLVLRIEPAGLRVFPEYDLGLQYGIMQSLAGTDVPVPRMLWRENDPAILGNPFYVMERIEGRIPDDNPPYHAAGWMTEITPEERASIWWSGIENLARIRAVSDVPVCVGFGVSTPEQAAFIGQHADGVVVGSALVDRIARAASREAAIDDAAAFVAALKAPLRKPR